jgi:hypothetical protein
MRCAKEKTHAGHAPQPQSGPCPGGTYAAPCDHPAATRDQGPRPPCGPRKRTGGRTHAASSGGGSKRGWPKTRPAREQRNASQRVAAQPSATQHNATQRSATRRNSRWRVRPTTHRTHPPPVPHEQQRIPGQRRQGVHVAGVGVSAIAFPVAVDDVLLKTLHAVHPGRGLCRVHAVNARGGLPQKTGTRWGTWAEERWVGEAQGREMGEGGSKAHLHAVAPQERFLLHDGYRCTEVKQGQGRC